MKKNNEFIKIIVLQIMMFISLLFVWLNYENKWLLCFNKYIAEYLDINNKLWLWILSIIIAIISYIKIKDWSEHKLVVNDNYILGLIFGIAVYVKYRIYGPYSFYRLVECCNISLCDIIALFATISVIVFIYNRLSRKKLQQNEGNGSFIQFDRPIKNVEEDCLEYKSHVERIIKIFMSANVSEHSWSMGIIGAWGSGKTSFVNMIEDNLKRNNQKVIIVRYNPRNASSTNKIQEDFFNTFRNSLKPYDNRVDRMIDEYMKALKILNDNKVLNAVISLWSNSNKEDIRKKISEVLKYFPYRVIVFIEDLDRLLQEEIIEVFKIIDGNACFPNVVYISSYDKEQVNRIIDEKYKNKLCFFTDKFFEFEFMLPIRPREYIYSTITKEIANIRNNENKRNSILTDLESLQGIVSEYITTLRDAKRFANQFKYDIMPVIDDVDFIDFFLVSIIKYKNQNIYKRLYDGEFTTYIPFEDIFTLKKKLADDAEEYIDILIKLFPENNKFSGWNRKIYDVRAFSIYFVNMLYNLISRKELEDILKGTWDNARKWADEIIENKKDKRVFDLERFLMYANFKDFGNKVKLENFIKLVFYTSAKNDTIILNTIKSLLEISVASQIVYLYKYTDIGEYKNFISDILNNNPPFYHSITRNFLIGIINGEIKEREIIFTREELFHTNLNYLGYAIGHINDMEETHISILYSCIDSIDKNTRNITLDKSSCEQIREFIIISPQYYIEKFVRPESKSSNPTFNGITCEPFWRQIIGDEEKMKSFIHSNTLDTVPGINRVRNFWRIYEKNNYMAIESTGQWNVQEQIDNDLVILNEYLDKMIKIEKEFEGYIGERNTLIRMINGDDFYKTKLQDFLNVLNSIPLHISYQDEIIKKIYDCINQIIK